MGLGHRRRHDGIRPGCPAARPGTVELVARRRLAGALTFGRQRVRCGRLRTHVSGFSFVLALVLRLPGRLETLAQALPLLAVVVLDKAVRAWHRPGARPGNTGPDERQWVAEPVDGVHHGRIRRLRRSTAGAEASLSERRLPPIRGGHVQRSQSRVPDGSRRTQLPATEARATEIPAGRTSSGPVPPRPTSSPPSRQRATPCAMRRTSTTASTSPKPRRSCGST